MNKQSTIIILFVVMMLPVLAFGQHFEVLSVDEAKGRAVMKVKKTDREFEAAIVGGVVEGWEVKKIAKNHVLLSRDEGDRKKVKLVPIRMELKKERIILFDPAPMGNDMHIPVVKPSKPQKSVRARSAVK